MELVEARGDAQLMLTLSDRSAVILKKTCFPVTKTVPSCC